MLVERVFQREILANTRNRNGPSQLDRESISKTHDQYHLNKLRFVKKERIIITNRLTGEPFVTR